MARIKPERVAHALHNLVEWRRLVPDQGSKHLLPLLALLEAGAGQTETIVFNERPNEFEFWDRYFRIDDGREDKPYFNPLTLRRAEKGFPHSNSATIRKNTFQGKWQAATREDTEDGENWSLDPNYSHIARDKMLTKGGKTTRAPTLDFACIMFRDEEFPNATDIGELGRRFRSRFPQSDADYDRLFELRPEEPEAVLYDPPPEPDYNHVIQETLLPETVAVGPAAGPSPQPPLLDVDDPVLLQVRQLIEIGTSGVILTGPPGTGKSFYAKRIAAHLVADAVADVFRVQLHPSYGYEDFVEGYRPEAGSPSGFGIVPKTFIGACERCRAVEGFVVLIVDEINRGDPARVFGEVLTYIERDYRDQPFTLPFSGMPFSVPKNLLLVGTMNPHDRSVSHVDAAFVRRFDHIELAPSRETAEALLDAAGGWTASEIDLVGGWFDTAQALIPLGLGHSFFAGVKGVDHLRLVWTYRMRPTAVAAVELNEGTIGNLDASFEALMVRLEGIVGD